MRDSIVREDIYNELIQILQNPNLESIVINGVAIKFTWYSFDRGKIHLFLKDENEKVIATVPLTAIQRVY